MAHLKHPDTGTEIECSDEAAKRYAGEGWKAVTGDGGDDGAGRRRKPARKAADD